MSADVMTAGETPASPTGPTGPTGLQISRNRSLEVKIASRLDGQGLAVGVDLAAFGRLQLLQRQVRAQLEPPPSPQFHGAIRIAIAPVSDIAVIRHRQDAVRDRYCRNSTVSLPRCSE